MPSCSCRWVVPAGLAAVLLCAGCATGTTSAGPDGSTGDQRSGEGLVFPDGGPRDGDAAEIPADGPPKLDQPVAAQITVTAPAAGASWAAGSKHSISWSSVGPVGAVDLELWRGGAKQQQLVKGQPASGSYAWLIPAALPGASNYTIRVRDPLGSATGSSAAFSITNWSYQVPVSIDASKAQAPLKDHVVRVELDSSFAYAHAKADGSDLRCSTSPSLPGSFDLSYWIESFKPGGASALWIRVPSIPATGTTTVYLYYGNPAATAASNFNATFPKRFKSTGNVMLGGTQSYDVFELQGGHTLTPVKGQKLVIEARRIIIRGTIDGNGRGHSGGAGGKAGAGPGGGGTVTGSGAGGGGYGGKGGNGGYDSGDPTGQGGNPYGASTSDEVQLGSGGGGVSTRVGGDGGGAVALVGQLVDVDAVIRVDGQAGQGGSGQNAGGGSGGGILVRGVRVAVSGQLSARGGHGGNGSSSANDGGGGGGGGRIKVFFEHLLDNSAVRLVQGGGGGAYGNAAPGQPGSNGSSVTIKQSWNPAVASVGAEKTL